MHNYTSKLRATSKGQNLCCAKSLETVIRMLNKLKVWCTANADEDRAYVRVGNLSPLLWSWVDQEHGLVKVDSRFDRGELGVESCDNIEIIYTKQNKDTADVINN